MEKNVKVAQTLFLNFNRNEKRMVLDKLESSTIRFNFALKTVRIYVDKSRHKLQLLRIH